MGHPLLERCVANGECAIAVSGVCPELGTCSALSVGRVPRSLTLGWARSGVYISGLQATPTTWHMSAPQEMGCISVSAPSVYCMLHSTGTHVPTCAGAPVYTHRADQSRTRLDHWHRADTLGQSATQFIRGLLATWPELNLCVDERPPKMTSTLRRLVCTTTVHDEQTDIPVQCARCSRWRLVLKENLKSDIRSGNPPKFNCGLQSGWSCNVPQDLDAQPLHHDKSAYEPRDTSSSHSISPSCLSRPGSAQCDINTIWTASH